MLRAHRSVMLTLVAVAVLASPGPLAGATQDATPGVDCPVTTPEENAALVTTYWAEVVKGEQGTVRELLAPNQVQHWGLGGDTVGVDAFLERFALRLTAFPDLTFRVDLVVAEDDLVATRFTATGTQTGEWQGIAPTGRAVTFRGNNVFRIECGRIAEAWGEADHLGVLEQLGAFDLPPQGTPSLDDDTLLAPAATPCPADTPEENVTVARRWTEEVLDGHNLDVLEAILAPDIVHRAGMFPDITGVDAVKETLGTLLTAFPDWRQSVELTVAAGDLVAVRWSGEGTQRGPILGHPPSQRHVAYSGTNIYRIGCGRIIEGWSEVDAVGLLQQISALPALATPGAAD
jgi:predicted ester cyclase